MPIDSYTPTVPLDKAIAADRDALVVRGTSSNDEISLGRRTGVTKWNKFGYNLDLDSGTEVVAAFGGTFTPLDSAETFTITYDGTGGGSTDGAGTNGAQTLYIQYVDADGLPAVAVHTLGTDGSDVTSFTGLGINRVAVSSSGSTDANGSAITITATTAGTTQASIPAGESVTQQCIFHVGSNHKAIVKFIKLNVLKLSGSSPVVTIKGWAYNRAVQTKYLIYREKIDTAVENTVVLPKELGFNLNATDVFWFEGTTNQDNTIVDMRFDLVEYQND